MILLQAKNVTKIYDLGQTQLRVLQDINLCINTGEFIAISGQSGSGKSTLMHILGCLDVPSEGVYLIEEKETSSLKPDQLAHIRNKKIGFVFQQFNLLQDLTALDNVALPQLYANASEEDARSRAKKLLEQVGLGDRLYHYPSQLSGGQQQRVSIARSIINTPEILLADEPTGNLDSKSGQEMMNIFIELNKTQQMTVVIVTHNMALAQKTHRIIQLLDGKIISDQKLI